MPSVGPHSFKTTNDCVPCRIGIVQLSQQWLGSIVCRGRINVGPSLDLANVKTFVIHIAAGRSITAWNFGGPDLNPIQPRNQIYVCL